VSCDAAEDILRLHFDGGETLSIWSPRGLVIGESTFRISQAERVRWEWFYYGRPMVAPNLRFEDYVRSPEGIVATTNAEMHDTGLGPDPSEAAVEIF
jgi:hypothetical protein